MDVLIVFRSSVSKSLLFFWLCICDNYLTNGATKKWVVPLCLGVARFWVTTLIYRGALSPIWQLYDSAKRAIPEYSPALTAPAERPRPKHAYYSSEGECDVVSNLSFYQPRFILKDKKGRRNSKGRLPWTGNDRGGGRPCPSLTSLHVPNRLHNCGLTLLT